METKPDPLERFRRAALDMANQNPKMTAYEVVWRVCGPLASIAQMRQLADWIKIRRSR